jgi:TRAP-type C4-dicarboxylate transport system substrate-binding protein
LGVTSFDALHAPFLVDDLGLLGEIAGSDLGAKMLEGLAPADLEGLAIWPESLRHPVSFAQPLVTAADFRGAKLRVPSSAISFAVAQAIGVQRVDPPDWSAAVAAGEMEGAESAFVWADGLPMYGTFTANVTFYPKANVVAANADVFDSLSDDQQDVLRRAATATLGYVIETNASERDLADQYCANGGSVVLADAADVAELVGLAEPTRSTQ